jgi:Rrf2 family protein
MAGLTDEARPDRCAPGHPAKFLEAILLDLKHAGIIKSHRGAEGGYALARPPEDISIADVIRAVDGPMATVRGERVETVDTAARRRACATCGWRSGPACGAFSSQRPG